ncbi:hypothetical protein K431DRAFT_283889 [Polychaeton citri CBS 116435]|uniref:Apple domain-containing protein n=1 Tax=Polychaeton citri CBS 116435 TaxID=1314669 RepID=A0A9P4UNL5_9PEZI|nr:hypothetical protein K431DRAFT_283889 [Polychaeton citri CBS 116435]
MQLQVMLALALPLLVTSSPIINTNNRKRAGGPVTQPIPSNCTVLNPFPGAQCNNATAGSTNGWMPSKNFTAAHSLYSAYYTSTGSVAEQWEFCSQQCYGYGLPGSCKSVVLAYDAPTPPGYYGTEGGDLETGCLMFDTYLDPNSFEHAPEGQYVNETAGSIYCPAS